MSEGCQCAGSLLRSSLRSILVERKGSKQDWSEEEGELWYIPNVSQPCGKFEGGMTLSSEVPQFGERWLCLYMLKIFDMSPTEGGHDPGHGDSSAQAFPSGTGSISSNWGNKSFDLKGGSGYHNPASTTQNPLSCCPPTLTLPTLLYRLPSLRIRFSFPLYFHRTVHCLTHSRHSTNLY